MKFCMVTTFYPPFHFGGDATHVRALSRALVAQGHEVDVVHCVDAYDLKSKNPPLTTENEDDGITVHRLKSSFGPVSPLITHQSGRPGLKASALREILKRPFDVVNFHNISLVGGPGIIRLSRAPVTLYTLHEHWLLCPTHFFWKNRSHPCDRPTCLSCSIRSGIPPQLWRYTDMAKSAVKSVDALIAPSEFTARLHREAGFEPEAKVIPLFSSLEPPKNIERTPPPRPQFLYVGRIDAPKGVAPMLEEFATLPDYDLDVIGDGECRGNLQRQFAANTNIRFLGELAQPDLLAHYENATALVFPSLAPETFGLTIIEALACGTPAIVRDAGGAREIIDETKAGVVYHNAEQLREALHSLAGNADIRAEMGKRGREGVLRSYTKERHVRRYLELIDSIANDPAKAVKFRCKN